MYPPVLALSRRLSLSVGPQIGHAREMDAAARNLKQASDRAELAGLMQRVASGDRRAFASVYDRTSAKLYGICLRLLGNEAEAQDVLQEAYVTLWRKAAQFDPQKASPITWLCVLVRNKALDRLRRPSFASSGLEAAADVPDESPSALEIVAHEQDAARLSHCLDEIGDPARTMIRAAFLDGATYPQLAERERVPLGTMKSWIRRGLQQLRGCLEQ